MSYPGKDKWQLYPSTQPLYFLEMEPVADPGFPTEGRQPRWKYQNERIGTLRTSWTRQLELLRICTPQISIVSRVPWQQDIHLNTPVKVHARQCQEIYCAWMPLFVKLIFSKVRPSRSTHLVTFDTFLKVSQDKRRSISVFCSEIVNPELLFYLIGNYCHFDNFSVTSIPH